MNKLSPQEEGPIDRLLLFLSANLLPFAYKTKHTPNILTTYSFACGIASLFALWNHNARWFAAMWSMSYFFDCMDGQMARRYEMTTTFGDYYDHCTDLLTAFGFVFVVLYKYSDILIRSKHLCIMGGMVCLSMVLSFVHIGCQQRVSHKNAQRKETLDKLIRICPTDNSIRYTKYFSLGTTQFLLVVFGVLLVTEKKRVKLT